jgi:hypothetical protein
MTQPAVTVDGRRFVDAQGRTLLLRGVNLGGSSKLPVRPDGRTHLADGFFDHPRVSFVGRPFPLAEADEHFGRLARWGLTFVRLLTTWEAIEHEGPGRYDREYLSYLRAIAEAAAAHGINVFIDPHQDVWSRWTGGDGAPGWTLETLGMDLRALAPTGAALTHQTTGDPFPRMIWPTNYAKLGAATMFTAFFAGDAVLPAAGVQDLLQSAFIGAMTEVARTLADLPNVVGYDTMNEPSAGWVDVDDLASAHVALLRMGTSPTPFESMVAAAGSPVEVGVYELLAEQPSAMVTMNPEGVRLWRDGFDCPWAAEGVWEKTSGGPRLLRPGHCAGRGFVEHHLKPFLRRYAGAIRSVHPQAAIFVEGVPASSLLTWGPDDPDRVVHAAHWYDALALFTKHYDPALTFDEHARELVEGEDNVRASVAEQLARIAAASDEQMGGVPTVIGEFGVPFDLDDGATFAAGDFSACGAALSAYIDAMDANLLSFTLWNYTADNRNERGDGWNGEDLSIFSRDQQDDLSDPDSGARGLSGFSRPYPMATAGTPVALRFAGGTMTYTFVADPQLRVPTEIFLPPAHYPADVTVTVTAGTWRRERDRLLIHTRGARDDVTVTVAPSTSAGRGR